MLLEWFGVICTSSQIGFISKIVLTFDIYHYLPRIVLEDLTAAGILQGNVDEMMAVNLEGR